VNRCQRTEPNDDRLAASVEQSRHLHRATVSRLFQTAGRSDFGDGHKIQIGKASCEVRSLDPGNALEKRPPTFGVVEPTFPKGLKPLFDRIGQPPERHGTGRIEDLRTAGCGDREH
jgi:hypothetical protein